VSKTRGLAPDSEKGPSENGRHSYCGLVRGFICSPAIALIQETRTRTRVADFISKIGDSTNTLELHAEHPLLDSA
jgi:hypothetical protein